MGKMTDKEKAEAFRFVADWIHTKWPITGMASPGHMKAEADRLDPQIDRSLRGWVRLLKEDQESDNISVWWAKTDGLHIGPSKSTLCYRWEYVEKRGWSVEPFLTCERTQVLVNIDDLETLLQWADFGMTKAWHDPETAKAYERACAAHRAALDRVSQI